MLMRIFVGLALCFMAANGYAQQNAQPSARLQLENLDKLSEKASHFTEVTLDGPMLEMAAKFIAMDDDPSDADMIAIIKNLKGIYIKTFEFDASNQYSQADVEAIRKQLAVPGWSRIVTDIDKRTGEKNEIYLLKSGDRVDGVTILVAEARELTVVNIVGAVPIDKIAKLQGQFIHDGKHGHKNKMDSGKKDKESSDEKK
jgi:hypothetical protein